MSRSEEFEKGHSDEGDYGSPGKYTLITQHGVDRKVRRKTFPSAKAATLFAEANHPGIDGKMAPNVDEKISDPSHPKYHRSFFWLGNRYAVLHRTGD